MANPLQNGRGALPGGRIRQDKAWWRLQRSGSNQGTGPGAWWARFACQLSKLYQNILTEPPALPTQRENVCHWASTGTYIEVSYRGVSLGSTSIHVCRENKTLIKLIRDLRLHSAIVLP